MTRNKIAEPTWGLATKLWWAYIWRTSLLGFVGWFFVLFISPFFLRASESVGEPALVLGGVFGLFFIISVVSFFPIYIYKRMLVKGFGRYKLQIVERDIDA